MTRNSARLPISISKYIAFIWLLVFSLQPFAQQEQVSLNSNQKDTLLGIGTNQTSASYLHQYMIARYEGEWQGSDVRESERQRLVLVSDIYIKAWSFAFWNKVFFIISLSLAFAVLIWPSISVIVPKKFSEKPIFKSAVVQTTITALAAASFFVYSDYKEKQLSAENLMRYVIHSHDNLQAVSSKVIEELTRIDKGLSFSKVINNSSVDNTSNEK